MAKLSEFYGRYEATHNNGGDGNRGVYRHYPQFIRLFRAEIEIMLERQKFRKSLREQLRKYLSGRVYDYFKLYEISTRGEDKKFTARSKSVYTRASNMIADDKKDFWYWLQDCLIECKLPICLHLSAQLAIVFSFAWKRYEKRSKRGSPAYA